MSGREAAVSDVVGTVILLAITATAVSVVMAGLSVGEQERELPRLDLKASASLADPSSVTLVHAGGPSLTKESLTLVVEAGGEPYYRGAFPGTGPWSLGESAHVTLTRPLAGGERLDVLVVSSPYDSVLADAPVDIVAAGATTLGSAAFSLEVREPPATPMRDLYAGSTFLVIAQVAHEEGRKSVLAASADLSSIQGTGVAPLYDDGTHGDVVAGDLNYSAYLVVPPEAPSGVASLPVTATSVEGRLTPTTSVSQAYVRILPPPVLGPPSITGFTPPNGVPNTQIAISGTNLQFVNSASFVNPTTGNAYGATWWIDSGGQLFVLAPPSAPTGASYRIAVTTPVGRDETTSTFYLDPLPGTFMTPPTMTGFNPTGGDSDTEVRITGTGFTFATSVTLTRDGATFHAPFWNVGSAGTELGFLVPRGLQAGLYRITVVTPGGSVDSSCCAPYYFEVPPPDELILGPPVPASGPPYTTVTMSGSGFLGVVAVTVGGTGVTYWVVDDDEMRFLTHAGVPLGPQDIVVYNHSDSKTVCCFDALPSPDEIEYPVYSSALFGTFAHTITKSDGAPTADHIDAVLKFDLLTDKVTISGQTYTLEKITLVYQPFKPGDAARYASPVYVCQPVAGPDGRIGIWNVAFDLDVPNYEKDADSLRFFYEFTWTNGRSGSNYDEDVFYVDSSLNAQYFTLRPHETTKVVYDVSGWPSTFTGCTP